MTGGYEEFIKVTRTLGCESPDFIKHAQRCPCTVYSEGRRRRYCGLFVIFVVYPATTCRIELETVELLLRLMSIFSLMDAVGNGKNARYGNESALFPLRLQPE